jgi:hypothetical protein
MQKLNECNLAVGNGTQSPPNLVAAHLEKFATQAQGAGTGSTSQQRLLVVSLLFQIEGSKWNTHIDAVATHTYNPNDLC